MDKIKVAVVGCGMISEQTYLPGIVKMEKANLVAVCDVVEARAKLLQAKVRCASLLHRPGHHARSGGL